MWEGETIVKLMNGQIWQQTEYHYDYHYAYMPNVLVYRSGGGYKMKVDGTEEAVGVPLRRQRHCALLTKVRQTLRRNRLASQ